MLRLHTVLSAPTRLGLRTLPLFCALAAAACTAEEKDDTGAAADEGGDGTADGADGADGSDGADGTDGSDGTDGTDGTDGSDGADGSDGSDGGPADPIAVAGSWVDDWGGAHAVSDSLWASGSSTFVISAYDNEIGYALALNGAENPWSPGLFSRFDWAWIEGELRYCQSAYDAPTEADALAVPRADAADLAGGCSGFSWTTLRAPFSLTGSWDDAWGDQHEIDAFSWWVGTAGFALAEVNEAERWLVAQNDASNSYFPGLWSRIDWAPSEDGGIWICQTAYNAESREDAAATPAADASDPATGGCGGFSWTAARRALPINGSWDDSWGGSHDISAWAWRSGSSIFDVLEADPEAGWLVARNGDDNPWSPGLYSRFDWTWDADGQLWYCQTAYAAESAEAARATPPADASDPASGGCSSFSWTALTERL